MKINHDKSRHTILFIGHSGTLFDPIKLLKYVLLEKTCQYLTNKEISNAFILWPAVATFNYPFSDVPVRATGLLINSTISNIKNAGF